MSRRATDLVFALLLGAAMLAFSLTSPNIAGGDDAYRHVRFAHRLATETRAALADPWSLTYLWPRPVDVWFGYHLLLAPLTLLLPLIPAAKVLGSLIWAGSGFALLRLLDSLKVEWRHAWAVLAVAGSGVVLYRVTLMRPFLISLLLMLLVTRFTLEEKPWHVALVSALHAFSYSIFFFVGLPPAVNFLARRTRRSFLLGVASGVGMATGLAASPFFPENVKFSWAAASTQMGPEMARLLKAGGEVMPISVWWLVASIPILGAWVVAIAVLAFRRQLPSAAQWLLLGMSLASLLISTRAARMFDYFVPFAALFAAVVLSPLIARAREKSAYAFGFVYLLCAASLVPAFAAVRSAPSVERYRAVSEFIAQQPGKTVVLNTAWQQYPFLYFWNWRSRYLSGMEPALFHQADPARYWQWRTLADDAVKSADEVPAFGATHIVVDRELTPKLAALLRGHPRAVEVFHDGSLSAFTLRSPQ